MHTLWNTLAKPLGWRNVLYVLWAIYALHLLALAIVEFTHAVHPEQVRVASWMLNTFIWFSLLTTLSFFQDRLIERYQKLTDNILKSWKDSGNGLVEMCKKLDYENTQMKAQLSVYEKAGKN